MPIYVNDLLINALKTVRLVTPFQPLRPEYLTDALYFLNEEISNMNANGLMIPYQSDLSFNIVEGKANYVIGPSGTVDEVAQPFIEVNYCDIFWNQLQYPVRIISDKDALDVFRSVNIEAIPDSVRVHLRIASDTNSLITELIFFNPPNQTYPVTIRGKQLLTYATLQTNITGLPDYYQKYFRLKIAKALTDFYPNNGWGQKQELDLQEAENIVLQSSDQDLWVRTPGLLCKKDIYLYNTYLGVRVP